MHAHRRHAEGHAGHRRGPGVGLGELVGAAAHQVTHRPAADPLPGCGREVEDTGLDHHPAERHPGRRTRSPGGQPGPGGRPGHQMTAGRVAQADHPPQVEPAAGLLLPGAFEAVHRGGDVLDGAGPAPAARPPVPPDAPVLHVEGRPAATDQVCGQRPAQLGAVGRPPEAAVHHHDHRHRSRPVGHAELDLLARVVAVAVGRGHRGLLVAVGTAARSRGQPRRSTRPDLRHCPGRPAASAGSAGPAPPGAATAVPRRRTAPARRAGAVQVEGPRRVGQKPDSSRRLRQRSSILSMKPWPSAEREPCAEVARSGVRPGSALLPTCCQE